MKAKLQLWPPRVQVEIPNAVYAILGLTTVAVVGALSLPHWSGRSISIALNAHGLTITLDLVKSDRIEVARRAGEGKTQFAERWTFENMAELTLPKTKMAENTQGEGAPLTDPKNELSSPDISRGNTDLKQAGSGQPKPPQRGHGYYYERGLVQGDAYEGEFEPIKRPCHPAFQMPLACYYPQKDRWKLPVYPN